MISKKASRKVESGPVHKNHQDFLVGFPHVIGVSCALALGALVFCEFWSLLFDFERSTAAVCDVHDRQVRNFMPSISMAVGRSTPQRYVWQICICLVCTPRILTALASLRIHRTLFPRHGPLVKFHHLATAACVMNVIETCALVVLSFVTSSRNYEVHKYSFLCFQLCSTLHMVSMCVLYGPGMRAVQTGLNELGQRSLKLKYIFAFVNISSFPAAMYFYYRHSVYCEDGVYSLFGICQVVLVVANIAFHATDMLDFQNVHVVLQHGMFTKHRSM